MDATPESLIHPLLGHLVWVSEESLWVAHYHIPSGNQLTVYFNPHRTDRYAFIEPATELFRWAFDNERDVLYEAISAYLLNLYNEEWRQDDEPMLSADDFAALMQWKSVRITASSNVPIEFWYDPVKLYEFFGGLAISVRVNANLQYHEASLTWECE